MSHDTTSRRATPLVQVDHLRIGFRMGRERNGAPRIAEAVKGVSFSVPENTTVALVGESGSGKSVSAMAIMRLLPENAVVDPASRIMFLQDGVTRDLLKQPMAAIRALRGKSISVVFQEPMTSLNPVFQVGEQIGEVLRLHLGMSRRQAIARAEELLAEVGIPEPRARLAAYPHELSGGQQQRVMIAMAIACEPRLLIADEPTTALDVTVQRQIIDLISRLQAKLRMSVLFISHDLGLVGEVASEVVVMRHGIVRESGAVEQVFRTPRHRYTQALMACRPRVDARPHRLPVILDFMRTHQPGELPPLAAVPVPPDRAMRFSEGSPLIEAVGLRKVYRLKTGFLAHKTVEAVKDVSFTLHRGRTLGVVGESGSGKTTLGMLLMRLVDATAGKAYFDGADLLAMGARELMTYRRRIQVIFQNPYASLNPRFTVGQILTEPMKIHHIGGDDDERDAKARALIDRVGLPRAAIHQYPHEFSGGQRQRIAIARCLSMRPEVLICDESVSALDVSVQATVLNLLLDLQDEFGMSYIFISHDLAVVRSMSDDVLVMNQGAVVERGSSEAIYADPQHAYTRRLLASVPRGF
jgi:peptide/nickel transport system ATP-binding protein